MAKNDNTNKPDWAEIKYEYVSSKKFLTDIAEEFNVPYSTLYKRATRENWPVQRQIFGEKADKKVYNRKTNAVARRYQDIDEAYGRIAAQLNDSVDPDGRELYLYPVYDENGKLKGFVELQRANEEHAEKVLEVIGKCKKQMDELYGVVSREKEMDHEVAMKQAEAAVASASEEGGGNGNITVMLSDTSTELSK